MIRVAHMLLSGPAMSVAAFLMIGLSIGLMSRALWTGRHSRGLVATLALAAGGAVVGGSLSFFDCAGDYLAVSPAGLFFAALGALSALAGSAFAAHRSAAPADEVGPGSRARF